MRTRITALILAVVGCSEVLVEDDGTSSSGAGATSGASTTGPGASVSSTSSSAATGGAGGIGIGGEGGSGGEAPCGNGSLDAGEECDDGNLAAGDGCAHDCVVECEPEDPNATYEAVWKDPITFHCYRRVGGNLGGDPSEPCIISTYSMILDDCLAWGGDAAAISTLDELDALIASPLFGSGFKELLIGAEDVTGMGDWIWHNGEPWIYAPGMPPWIGGEPVGGTFLELWAYGDGSGLNADVEASACGFLCERTPAM